MNVRNMKQPVNPTFKLVSFFGSTGAQETQMSVCLSGPNLSKDRTAVNG